MRKTLKTSILVCAGILLISPSAIAEPPKYARDSICPEFIEAEAKFAINNPPKGWAASQTRRGNLPYPSPRYNLEYVEFFLGSPERNSALMPDKGNKEIGSIWELNRISKDPGVWIGCFYAGGFINLSKQLPVTTTECIVKTTPSVLINGHHMITSIQCK